MLTQFFTSRSAARRRGQGWLMATLVATIIGTVAGLTGCGGGSSSSSDSTSPTPTPTVTPSTSPTPTGESARDRAIRLNYNENYISPTATQYLRWNNNKNLRVFIHQPVVNKNSTTPSSNISVAKARSVVEQAIANWSSATDNDFTFTIVDNVSNADIQIFFVDQVLRSDGSVSTGVGITNYFFNNPNPSDLTKGILTSAVAQVLSTQADANLVDTTTHEVGHSLGIEDHSPNDNDLMFATSLPPATITQRDQNTVFFLYYSSTANSGRAAKISGKTGTIHASEIE